MVRVTIRRPKGIKDLCLNDSDVMPEAPSTLLGYEECDEEYGYLVALNLDDCAGNGAAICLSRDTAEELYYWLGQVLED